MIAFLSGKILNKGKGYIILRAGDVGYKIFINSVMYVEMDIGQASELYIHQHVREDSVDLFGFKSLRELEMFEMLLSISGVGPKSALGILSIANVDEIRETISRGDPSLLIKVSGIGRKTAERVVLELREKVGEFTVGTKSDGRNMLTNSDEIDALMALGYSLGQAREALNKVESSVKDSGERIRQALKQLGK